MGKGENRHVKAILIHNLGITNEHIVAVSHYYCACENITDSQISFRYQDQGMKDALETNCDCMDYFRDVYDLLYRTGTEATPIQNLGEVRIQKGRLLAFPNVYQHRISNFRLQDSSKPGRCIVLALFLVDPNMRIISTANVPPQQLEWWTEHTYQGSRKLSSLQTELISQNFGGSGNCPYSLSKAGQYKKELLEERTTEKKLL